MRKYNEEPSCDCPLVDSCQECYGAMPYDARDIPEGLTWLITRSDVGPKEDSYSRVVYAVHCDGNDIELTECALAGTTLRVNGVDIIKLRDGDESLASLWFEALTGVRPYDIEAWDHAGAEQYADIHEAELAAGWDASP